MCRSSGLEIAIFVLLVFIIPGGRCRATRDKNCRRCIWCVVVEILRGISKLCSRTRGLKGDRSYV